MDRTAPDPGGPLSSATRAVLGPQIAAGDVLAVAALAVAERIEEGGDTAAGYAALLKAFRTVYTDAAKSQDAAPDAVDELTRRRHNRRTR